MNDIKVEKRRKRIRSMARCRAKMKYSLTEDSIRRIIREELAAWRFDESMKNNP